MPRHKPPLRNGRSRSRSPLPEASTAPSNRARPRYGASDVSDREQPSRHSDSHAPTIRGEDNSDEDDDSPQIIMAADQRGSKMGCAYYMAAESKLCIFGDVELSPDIFDAVKFQVSPTVLLLSSGMRDTERATHEDGEEIDRPYQLLNPVAGEFTYEHGRRKLMALRFGEERGPEIILPADLHDVSSQERSWEKLLKLSSWIHVNCNISVGCAGAVVAYLQSRKYKEEGGHGEGPQFQCIEVISLQDVMLVDSDMMCSLQIFENKSHPNMHMQGMGGRGKEGLSLFGILNYTRSPMGYKLLKQWFLRPSLSIDMIEKRQAGVAILMHDENSDALNELGKCLKRIKNIPKILELLKMGKGSARGGSEYALHAFMAEAVNIRFIVEDMVGWQRAPVFTKIMKTFDHTSLQGLHMGITRIVNFKESAAAGRVVVNTRVDPDLDALKEKLAGLPDALAAMASAISDSVGLSRNMRQGIAVVRHPNYGFLVSVPKEHKRLFSQTEFRYRFRADGATYCSHYWLEQLTDTYADVEAQIRDLEIKILLELRVHILKHEDFLVAIARVCAELDCLMSFAESAVKNRYNRPKMTKENFVDIRQGRHPLQELGVDKYVANDCRLASSSNAADSEANEPEQSECSIFLNGPNLYGKTVYVEQVMLIIYMAHIGSFVPAERAVVGLTGGILGECPQGIYATPPLAII